MKILDLVFGGVSDLVRKRLKERTGGKANYKLKCPKCEEQIDLGMKACPKCGTPLGKLFVFSCPRCGHKNPIDAEKCAKCGENLDIEREIKQTYRCPRCGYVADYYMSSCPACGLKFV